MIPFARSTLRVRPISLGLAGLAGAAALAAGLWPLDLATPGARPGARPLDLAGLAAADSSAAVSRPLFDPERRAWSGRGSREDLLAESPPPTLLTVKGILIEDRVRRALVADGTTPPAWLSPGEGRGEGRGAWRLVSIERAEVVVADANRHYTLAFLGAPVALRPAPRHPAPQAHATPATPGPSAADPDTSAAEMPALRPSLGPATTPAEHPAESPAETPAATVRRIPIAPAADP